MPAALDKSAPQGILAQEAEMDASWPELEGIPYAFHGFRVSAF